MARQRHTDREALRRPAAKERTRSWPQFVVLLGVVALLVIGAVLMLRPVEHVQQTMYPVKYREAILESCERHGVSPYLVCAIIKCESGWREDVVSGAGATGLMQVMPSTATSLVNLGYVDASAYPPENLQDPLINIEYGCATLEFLSRQLESEEQIIAAYNAGINTVLGWLAEPGSIPFQERIVYPETAAYLTRVLDAYGNYKTIYDEGLNER